MGVNNNVEVTTLGLSAHFEKGNINGNEGESHCALVKNSLLSHVNKDCNKTKTNTKFSRKNTKKESGGNYLRPTKVSSGRQEQKDLQPRSSNNGSKKSRRPNEVSTSSRTLETKKLEIADMQSRSSSELSEEIDYKSMEEVKEIDILDEAAICNQSVGTDDSVADAEVNKLDDMKMDAYQKIEELKIKIEKLEEELREVAALEISIYSVVPEHGNSTHKVHAPARRLARLYLHACKHWSQDKSATVAKNTVSGLLLVAKSCGNEVPRLTFWLSNTVALREIISQTFGYSSVAMKHLESASDCKMSSYKLQPLKSKNNSEGKQSKVLSFVQVDDWHETTAFIAVLEKLESWIFSKAVESVWWQALTPQMQLQTMHIDNKTNSGKLLGPVQGDPKEGFNPVILWKRAFHVAFSKLCPVRSGGHQCGCMPTLSRLVMEECMRRLDIAMFNAILRESANEMPTDPISDPVFDPKVLPIPAGDLSFGSGAHLKNSVGNWARCLSDLFGTDTEKSVKDEAIDHVNGDNKQDNALSHCFLLLNELSNLLMLPKDMLLDRTIRKEVCPSFGLPLITRVLCNFSPDEFCPDPVPSIVLDDLISESVIEGKLADNEHINTLPFTASSIIYSPPSLTDVSGKISDAEEKSPCLQSMASMLLRRGYTSDEDLNDLDNPLTSLIDQASSISLPVSGYKAKPKQISIPNLRFNLLREVWCE
ncbi:hypothetical protein HPP92_019683 [Vanilla planifolia]|uniref:Dilute domain-containing protein n=1 Tax=Vanilla planifolia TaxID=51239 RepID=A0A835UHS9_VANPL|nr:hypothetical protein HPP92_019683 [Vanilla planifolia]